jgi:diguanylate cyclase (GGDEF)-like protein/PAS domain S-box-containing protein
METVIVSAPLAPVQPLAAHVYREFVEQAQVGMFVVQDGCFRYVNPKVVELLGYPQAALLGMKATAVVHPQDAPRVAEHIRQRMAGIAGMAYDIRCVRADGSLLVARVFGRAIMFDGRAADLVTLSDVSEIQHARELSDWRARMLAQTELLCRSGSVEIDLACGRATLSSGAYALLGETHEPGTLSIGAALRWIPRDERRYLLSIWRGAAPGDPFEFQHRILRADGSRLEVLHRGIVEPGTDGVALRGVVILQDITAQREAEGRIQELANFDELTGLPNRVLLLDRVDAATHAAQWDDGRFTLLSLNIAQVDQIEETMGFGAGDTLAMAIAARLSGLCKSDETLAHLGGGEFAILLDPAVTDDEGTVLARARTILDGLRQPESVGQTEVYLSCSVGVATYPSDADNAQRLLECAQTARLQTDNGASRIAFFTPQANVHAVRRMTLESALRRAIGRQELSLHYQPQVDLTDGRLVGVEALIRWNCSELGDVEPSEFIPVAEQTGLIIPIGEWVLRSACAQVTAWARAGLPDVRVHVNLSPLQLQQPDIARRLHAILLETGANPAHLGVEVTESMLTIDAEHASRTLRELKAIGVEIALDDFGTGYSNLGVLRTLPIDVVKIDRSFVHDVTAAPEDVSITRAVLTMAHGLQMKVLAEGVETEGQLNLLIANGCDMIQGFFFSEPVAPAQIEQMLRDDRRLPERFLTRSQRKRTLLLVDDEQNIVSSLRRLFRRDGYDIVTANSGAEGLQRLAEVNIDVIVSDQRMPGMTGVEFLRRAKELYPDTVRMVLSGYTELQSITDAVNEGAIYKFLTKPWDDERLRAHVAEAFRQKDLADENRRLAHEVHNANHELACVNQRLEELLARQREQTSLEESRAANARGVLENVPAPIIGIDADGMIAFVNRDAQALLSDGAALIGCDADDALPPELAGILHLDVGVHHPIHLAGHPYRAVCREMSDTAARGKLLVITHEYQRELT